MFPTVSILAYSVSLAGLLDVLVVQQGGLAGTFPNIQVACDAAHERDTILVEAGTYPGFTVIDKWLTITSDSGSSPTLTSGIQVRELEPGKRVTLVGLVSRGLSPAFPALGLRANQGAVRVTNCSFQGSDATHFEEVGGDGVRVEQCSDVSFSNCSAIGGLAAYGYAGPAGGAGMRVLQSTAAVYDCTLIGGRGSDGSTMLVSDGGDGGDGCRTESSELFASHTTFRGGQGGDGVQSLAWTTPGSGGNGLAQHGGIARVISPSASGGTAGWGPMGYPGQPISPGVITLPVTFRQTLVSQDPIREGSTLNVVLAGQPGDKVVLALTPYTSSTFNAAWNGQQLFPAGTAFLRCGTISAGGSLSKPLTIAELGPGVQARTYQAQALFAGTDGYRVLGTPVSLVVLDSAY